MYLESETERVFAIACLVKKLVFHTEICDFFKLRLLNFKNRSFLEISTSTFSL